MGAILRRIAERLSRGVTLRRRLPRQFGSAALAVAPFSGGLKYWRRDLGKVDPDLLRLAALVQPGSCVWDVGANLGLFSFAAAYRAGHAGEVVAFEPDFDNVRLLLQTKRGASSAAGYAPVEIVPCAVAGAGSRLARFEIAARARASNALQGFGNSQMGGILETRWVPVVTMDDMLNTFRAPQFIKVDVEGAEAELLSGSARVLKEVRPVLMLEVSGECASRVTEALRSRDYILFDGQASKLFEREVPSAPWNCLAIPRGRVDEMKRWAERTSPLGGG